LEFGLKRNATAHCIGGLLIWVDETTFNALKKLNYPSLYSNRGVGYVLTGPLSLATTTICRSNLGLSTEKFDKKREQITSLHQAKGHFKEGRSF
jgi:hypothetical protein